MTNTASARSEGWRLRSDSKSCLRNGAEAPVPTSVAAAAVTETPCATESAQAFASPISILQSSAAQSLESCGAPCAEPAADRIAKYAAKALRYLSKIAKPHSKTIEFYQAWRNRVVNR